MGERTTPHHPSKIGAKMLKSDGMLQNENNKIC